MRTSYSPTRREKVPVPTVPDVSLCVVTHYENKPWYKDRWDIIVKSIESMVTRVGKINCELIIWDNASPIEFVKFSPIIPTVLIKSPNIGNYNARRNMLQIARAPIVCLADDDILYSPDWLNKQLAVLHTFPHVGFVHGCPSRMTQRDALTYAWAHKEKIITDKEMSEEWKRDFVVSRGMPSDTRLNGKTGYIEYKGVGAWICSLDMQMLGYKDVIAPFYAIPSDTIFDTSGLVGRMCASGLHCLSTADRTAIHMGNVLDKDLTL